MSEQNEDKTAIIQKAFSDTAIEFAENASKQAEVDPESLKVENLPMNEQVEYAAQFFKMYMPIFKSKLRQLTTKARLRVMERLVEYPLQNDKLTWAFQNEKDCFLIGDRLLETKYAMFRYVINEEIQKIKDVPAPASTEEKKEGDKPDGEV